MTFKEKVKQVVEEALLEKPSIFLIDLTITDSFKIIIGIDGDNGVVLQDCIDCVVTITPHVWISESDDADHQSANGALHVQWKIPSSKFTFRNSKCFTKHCSRNAGKNSEYHIGD